MGSHQDLFGWMAAIVSFMAYPIYIVEFIGNPTKTHWSTRWIWRLFRLKGGTSPHQASWLIWAVLQIAIFTSARKEGASSTTWMVLMYLIGSSLTFLFALRFNDRKWTTLDVTCMALAAVSLWLMFGHPLQSLALAIITDGIAAIPTIIGVTRKPQDESVIGWAFFTAGALINLGAIKNWSFADAGFTLYVIVVIGYIFLLATLGRLRKRV